MGAVAVGTAGAVLGVGCWSVAVAEEQRLAPAADRGATSAYGGWVVWSEQVAERRRTRPALGAGGVA
jgi:hypothetical protein